MRSPVWTTVGVVVVCVNIGVENIAVTDIMMLTPVWTTVGVVVVCVNIGVDDIRDIMLSHIMRQTTTTPTVVHTGDSVSTLVTS